MLVRARPLNALERERNGDETCITLDGNAVRLSKTDARIAFDHVFGPDTTQNHVFAQVGPASVAGVLLLLVLLLRLVLLLTLLLVLLLVLMLLLLLLLLLRVLLLRLLRLLLLLSLSLFSLLLYSLLSFAVVVGVTYLHVLFLLYSCGA